MTFAPFSRSFRIFSGFDAKLTVNPRKSDGTNAVSGDLVGWSFKLKIKRSHAHADSDSETILVDSTISGANVVSVIPGSFTKQHRVGNMVFELIGINGGSVEVLTVGNVSLDQTTMTEVEKWGSIQDVVIAAGMTETFDVVDGSGSPVDLSSYVGVFKIIDDFSGSTVLEFVGSPKIVLGNGTVVVTLLNTDLVLSPGNYRFNIHAQNVSERFMLTEGTVTMV